MTTGSPHLYRREGRARGKPEALLDAALTQTQSVEANGLAAVLTLNHLAVRTGVSYNYLRGIVERKWDPYDDIVLKRRNGRGMRPISAPHSPLMRVQRWILHRIVDRVPVHADSYAYQAGSSIRSCASRHAGARWLVKLDIRNFFETIDERRVYTVFHKAGYVQLVALELARLCTRSAAHASHVDSHRFLSNMRDRVISPYSQAVLGFLPQGAPTSGALANLIFYELDTTFSRIAQLERMVYTRYADDLTFSTIEEFSRSQATSLIREVGTELRRAGFSLHEKKTRIVPPGARKAVLGLLVDNNKVRLNRIVRGRITDNVRGVEKFGLAAHVAHRRFSSLDGFVRHVSGLLAFAADVEPEWAHALGEQWRTALHANNWSEPSF
ncbi:reverse transcriptase family protein [Paractinoplanes durhamensis]|uniref:RNA-directed DNA polymerase n=1 Tax=Paractinoplanes durhamensis TaxID=113563 RepID=A0ABQ3Z2N9_9ACTN|nr:reverse transcriptase family protein [Actinoplanes durhamensis]GIE04080.1 RNA-directed DNA polymerase [Actinoplanes durhamensis]